MDKERITFMDKGSRKTMSSQSISIGEGEEINMKRAHQSLFIFQFSEIQNLKLSFWTTLNYWASSLLSSEIFHQQKMSNTTKQDLRSFISIKTKMSRSPQGMSCPRMHQKDNKEIQSLSLYWYYLNLLSTVIHLLFQYLSYIPSTTINIQKF